MRCPIPPHLGTLVLAPLPMRSAPPISPSGDSGPPWSSPPAPHEKPTPPHLAGFGPLWASVSPFCGRADPSGDTSAPSLASGPGTCTSPAGRNVGPPALDLAGQRTQAGWPGRGYGLGAPARAGLRRTQPRPPSSTLRPRSQAPSSSRRGREGSGQSLRFPRPGPFAAPDPQKLKSSGTFAAARASGRRRFPGTPPPLAPRARAPRARVPGAAGPELPEASAPPPPALARGSPGRTGPRPAPPDPRGRCTGYRGRDGGRSRAGPVVTGVGVGPATAGTEGQGQRGKLSGAAALSRAQRGEG